MSQPQGHGLHVEFYMSAIPSGFESEKAGRPIHVDAEFIHIMIPGDSKTVIERVVTEEDKRKYAVEYAAFKAGKVEREQASGTPLSEWPAMPRSLVRDLEHLHIHTVEQLANLSDVGKQSFGMGAEAWCGKAKAFIETAKNSAYAEQLVVENMDLRRRIEDMEKQFASLSSRVEKAAPQADGIPPELRRSSGRAA